MKIHVNIPLEVEPSNTINDIKSMIYHNLGIPVDKQLLSFAGRELLEDTRSLFNYNIREDSSLRLVVGEEMQILIEILTTGSLITLQVDKVKTIKDVKIMIQAKDGTPPNLQILILKGMELEDHKTLVSYGISKDSRLGLVLRAGGMRILLVVNGKRITLKVENSIKVYDVKAMIKAKEGFPIEKEQLLFMGKPLEDGLTLAHYDIQNESTIYYWPRLGGKN